MPAARKKSDKKSSPAKTGEDLSLVEVLTLAESSIRSMKGFMDSLDSSIFTEFKEIATYIQSTKKEIGQLRANELRDKHIPEAGTELSAIVTATEDATSRIMESAEQILEADPDKPDAYKKLVNDKVMEIFEACSFQDITGQRIARVVETLEHIESRVERFASAIGAEDAKPRLSAKEAQREKRKKDLILNGPANEGEGVSQNEIDALLND